jgi:hypothetical protein
VPSCTALSAHWHQSLVLACVFRESASFPGPFTIRSAEASAYPEARQWVRVLGCGGAGLMAARLLGSAGAAFAVSSPKLECVSPAKWGLLSTGLALPLASKAAPFRIFGTSLGVPLLDHRPDQPPSRQTKRGPAGRG